MAYEYATGSCMEVSIGEKKQQRTYEKRDQFGAELVYFSDCVLHNRKPEPSGEEGWADGVLRSRKPEPSGEEGLADVRIIQAILESARTGLPVKIRRVEKQTRPSRKQEISRPAVTQQPLVHAEAGSE